MEFVENTSASTASTCDMTDNATYPTIEANADHDAVAGGDGDDGEDHGSESNLQNFLGHLTMEEYRNIVHEYLTASSHISSTSSVEEFYRMNQQRYLNMAILSSSKHGFLPKASNGLIDVETLQSHSNIVQSHAHKSDFSVIQLIRFLFLDHVDTRPHRDGVGRILQNFSFWTGKAKDDSRRRAMEHTIFWSENHIFMYLSSAYLFHQYLSTGTSTSNQPNTNTCPTLASSCVNHHDCNQLLIYLESHTHPKFQGVYEVLSCTYLPWTICALLNLYDYARDENVRHHAKLILDNIVTTFCLVATKDGICNLTASARQYQDLRTKTWNHNITLLIILITGVIYDPMDVKPSPLGDFLATSSYQPPHDIISNYFNYHGSVMRKKMNHLVKETKEIYQAGKGLREVKDRELTPFYW